MPRTHGGQSQSGGARGGQSPTNVTHYLKGIQFPANKQDLVERAKDNGAEGEMLELMEQMPDAEYGDMAGVMKAYGEGGSGSSASGSSQTPEGGSGLSHTSGKSRPRN